MSMEERNKINQTHNVSRFKIVLYVQQRDPPVTFTFVTVTIYHGRPNRTVSTKSEQRHGK